MQSKMLNKLTLTIYYFMLLFYYHSNLTLNIEIVIVFAYYLPVSLSCTFKQRYSYVQTATLHILPYISLSGMIQFPERLFL